ncbi:proline racemase family protein [Lysinibacillus sp. MHQ-1]|nr:proline racemase family protein [Lysinibacillus sp. MHQ-1]
MQENYDWIRKFLMNEPRGHSVMSGVIITEPCQPEADFGVIYIETGGYLPMCGHDTIGVCTALIEANLIEVTTPFTNIKLDTPAGLIDVQIKVTDGVAKEVTFKNVPSFLLKTIEINDSELGVVECEIAYGGNFYGIIDARKINLDLAVDNSTKIINTAIRLRNAVNAVEDIVHPEYSFIHGLTHIEFYTDPVNPLADLKKYSCCSARRNRPFSLWHWYICQNCYTLFKKISSFSMSPSSMKVLWGQCLKHVY